MERVMANVTMILALESLQNVTSVQDNSTSTNTGLHLSRHSCHVLYNNNQTASTSQTLMSVPLILGLVPLILITAAGNALVIAAVKLERRLRTPTNYLTLSLAVTDLLVATCVMPLSLINEVSPDLILVPFVCHIWILLDVNLCTVSIIHLLVIAVDRYRSVTNIHYRCKRSTKKIMAMVSICWGAGWVVCAPLLFGMNDPTTDPSVTGECMVDQSIAFTLFSTMTAFFLPAIIMVTLYYNIYIVAKSSIRKTYFKKLLSNEEKKTRRRSAPECLNDANIPRRTSLDMPRVHYGSTRASSRRSVRSSRFSFDRDRASIGSHRSSIAYTRSSVDSGHSNVGCSRSSVDIGRTCIGCSRPIDDSHQSSVDFTQSSVDRGRPSIGCSRSSVDSGRKSIDQSRFRTDSGLPSIGCSRSSVDSGRPISSVKCPRPSVDSGRISIDCSRSSVDSHQSSVDFTQSSVDSGRPSIGCSRSSVGSGQTSIGCPRSSVDSGCPSIECPRSRVDSGRTSIDCPRSKFDRRRPSIGSRKSRRSVGCARSSFDNHRGSISFSRKLRLSVDYRRPRFRSLTLLNRRDMEMFTIENHGNHHGSLRRQTSLLNLEEEKKKHEAKRERRAARTLGIITGAFIVCWLPFFSVTLISPLLHCDVILPSSVRSFVLWLGYFNCTINPIIYTVFNLEFRKAFRNIVCCHYRTKRTFR